MSTDKNYEKMYKDALERAKIHINIKGIGDTVDLCKQLFPELCESEYERIRKSILHKMEACKKQSNFFSEEEISWLEKQKEQKHPNGCFTCDEYKKGYEEGRRNGFTAGYNKAMKEVEQKEQKPWKVGANAYFTPEQKPVEWSEEDKRMLNVAIKSCEQTIEDYPNDKVRFKDCIDWLKSLRFSWKPTEKQMEAIKHAYNSFPNDCPTKSNLMFLYRDLEKLM